MLVLRATTQFRKDLQRMIRRGQSEREIRSVIAVLQSGTALDPKHEDHPLKGRHSGWRECHIRPDWLLLYRVEAGVLVMTRTGTHDDLFGR